MRNQASNAGAAFGYTNTYINRGFYPGSELPAADRQYKAQLAQFAIGSGEYNLLNPDKWLKLTSTGGSLNYGDFRIGVGIEANTGNDRVTLQTGESIIIEPGTDFPSTHFGAFEFREAVNPNFPGEKLNWAAYDGMTMVASGTTSGVDQNYNFIQPGVKFNKVVISGKDAVSRAGIGRPSNQVMSAYPNCTE